MSGPPTPMCSRACDLEESRECNFTLITPAAGPEVHVMHDLRFAEHLARVADVLDFGGEIRVAIESGLVLARHRRPIALSGRLMPIDASVELLSRVRSRAPGSVRVPPGSIAGHPARALRLVLRVLVCLRRESSASNAAPRADSAARCGVRCIEKTILDLDEHLFAQALRLSRGPLRCRRNHSGPASAPAVSSCRPPGPRRCPGARAAR